MGLGLENGWFPLQAVMVEGQYLPCAIPLIFQGEWHLELLNIPRRAINLILAPFDCRMKWLVFLAIFIFPSQYLALWFSGSQAHGFLPSFLSWTLSPFGCCIFAEFSPAPDPGAFSQSWAEEIQELQKILKISWFTVPFIFQTFETLRYDLDTVKYKS